MSKRRNVTYACLDPAYPYPASMHAPRLWTGFAERNVCVFVGRYATEDAARAAVLAITDADVSAS